MNIICSHTSIKNLINTGFENIMLDLSFFCSPWELERYGKEQPEREYKKRESEKCGRKPEGMPNEKTEKKTKIKTEVLVSEHPSELYGHIKPMVEQCKKADLHIPVVQAPYLPDNTERMDLNDLLFQLAWESIRCCGKMGCQYLIINPLFAGIKYGEAWKENRAFYLRLAESAKKHDVRILLRNQCRNLNGHLIRGICSDAEEAVSWVDRLNVEVGEERFGFCMDVGICNLCGQNMHDFTLKLGDRLKAVVLRGGDGRRANAFLPFTAAGQGQSGTDWLNLIRGLRMTDFDGQLILDCRDTVAAFPLSLRRELIRLAKSVADYFKWQIEMEAILKKYSSIVLFGAGNMCRNYMKCYGEKYPPLFTCDNNRRIWGTDFCGLKVEPPERLKELPEDCAVFICNIYYEEIREQLRAMGVNNPIEYFNDEYMPSYYFDRLEMSQLPVQEE